MYLRLCVIVLFVVCNAGCGALFGGFDRSDGGPQTSFDSGEMADGGSVDGSVAMQDFAADFAGSDALPLVMPDLAVVDGPIVAVDLARDGAMVVVDLARSDSGGYMPDLAGGDGTLPDLTQVPDLIMSPDLKPVLKSVEFGPTKQYNVMGSLQHVIVSDINGDGKLDLAATNTANGEIVIFFGSGDGLFEQPGKITKVGKSPARLTAAKIDGDGKLDLVVANEGSGDISILLGNGNGTFKVSQIAIGGSQPFEVETADWNADGKLDIAMAEFQENRVSILLGNGDGTFKAPNIMATGSGPRRVMAWDWTGDGKLDLAVENDSHKGIDLFPGKGDGTFEALKQFQAIASSARTAEMADLNRDGKMDIAVAYGAMGVGNGVGVLISTGNAGLFKAPIETKNLWAEGYLAPSIALVDVDWDGKHDLLLANAGGTVVSLLMGAGDGTFVFKMNLTAGNAPKSLAIGDLNGDEKPDLVVANSAGIGVLLNTSK